MVYCFTVYNLEEETQVKDFLGIFPTGPEIDVYLSGLTQEQLIEWKDYWVNIWSNLNRQDIVNFTIEKYNEYSEEPPIPPPEEDKLKEYLPYILIGGGALLLIISR